MIRRTSALSLIAISIVLLSAASVGAAEAEKPKPQLRKLKAFALVTVKPVAGAEETTAPYIIKLAKEAIPAGAFEQLTVLTEGKLDAAKTQAREAKADIFLSIVIANPERVKIPLPPVAALLGGRGRGGRRRRRTIDVLRTHVAVQMSVLSGAKWKPVKAVKFSSADAPPAEAGLIMPNTDIAEKWGAGVKATIPAAVYRTLGEYFFRGVTLKAEKVKPEKKLKPDDIDPEAGPPKAKIRISLANRSHCRIIDAVVTVQRYNGQRKRWEPIDGYERLGVGGRRGGGRGGRGGRGIAEADDAAAEFGDQTWKFAKDIDPGEQVTSAELALPATLLAIMNRAKCRFVLQGTPAVETVLQPTRPRKLKPKPKADPPAPSK